MNALDEVAIARHPTQFWSPDRNTRSGVEYPLSVIALLLAVLTPLFVPATPVPSPLPEIGRVRSNALCTTLRQNIAPTVLGLMRDDEIIGAGHRAFAKMSRDSAGTSGAAIDIDKLYLEQIETRLVHNLGVIDRKLGDEKRFPSSAQTADEHDADVLKAQLLAVAAEQRKALDLVSGTLATESLGQMRNDISGAMQGSLQPPASQPQTAATADPTSFIGVAGLPDYEPVAAFSKNAKLSNLAGHTVFDQIALQLERTQNSIVQRENVATATVIRTADECHAVAAPSPAPSLSP